MERRSRDDKKLPLCISVVVLGLVSSSCCIAAEFSKVKVEDMKLDGNLCSLPRSCAFGLGIAALVCLSTSQIIGTTMARSIRRKAAGGRIASVSLLLPSWAVYGVSSVLLATASSMNGGQRYGTGWMNGDCYIVRDGVYACSAALAVFVMLLTLALGFATAAAGDEPRADGERCGPQLKEPRVVDSVKG
ncbi:protein MODIFYING WALL LIGNIN-1-like [Zingiber officinale]|uniref:protein MODIFYING WALL LIGNIN-1-like n=1 Tax=Zingiber officinale TaxID=94328 RepID=UPI001C4D4881|nr:protein MODIFYING WALL LIGNIN-1-like [Zingiber officinale]